VLIRRSACYPRGGSLAVALGDEPESRLDRSSFLRRSGLVVDSLAALGSIPVAIQPSS
jgi:hypothetical protein